MWSGARTEERSLIVVTNKIDCKWNGYDMYTYISYLGTYIRSKPSLTVDKKYNKQNCDENLF